MEEKKDDLDIMLANKNKKDQQNKNEKVVDNPQVENVETPQTDTTNKKHKIIELNRYQVMSIVFASLLVVFILTVGIVLIVKNHKPPRTPLAELLTEENYNKIEEGQTLQQVTDIFGAGRQTSTSNNEIVYVWESNTGKYLVVTFTVVRDSDNKLVAGVVKEKGQSGIIVSADDTEVTQ